jgi:nucleoside-diphosphate-sugar epimerase
MERRVAIVTGGLRGLGRAMAFGLARAGHDVAAVGHIDTDIAQVEAATAGANFSGCVLPLVADLRRPADCDRVVAMARQRLGTAQILVNNAGLTFTTIDSARFRRNEPQKFWQVADEYRARRHRDQSYRRRPDGPPCRTSYGRGGLGPDHQCHDQARHDEPTAHRALRRLEGSARNGDRGVGQGGRGDRSDNQHCKPRRRR